MPDYCLLIGIAMYIARPDAPVEAHKLVERRFKNAAGGSEKTGLGLVSIAALYVVIFREQLAAHPLLRDAIVGIMAGLLFGFLGHTIVTPARNIRKLSRYVKQGHVVEVPDELWSRYAEICKGMSVEPQLSNFSDNIPILTAQIMPAYSRSVEASEKAKVHLQRFVDAKLSEIAAGSASLTHRDEHEELEALKTEFPVDNDPDEPKTLR